MFNSHMHASPQKTNWIVLKFGGTSVSQRHRWDTIGRLMQERATHEQIKVLVVVSALSGVTNQLQAAIDRADDDVFLAQHFQTLRTRHLEFCSQLEINGEPVLDQHLNQLQNLFVDARRLTRDFAWQAEVLAHGELLSSSIGVAYLQSQNVPVNWLDAREYLHASKVPNQSAWAARLSVSCDYKKNAVWRDRFDKNPNLVISQGFIARSEDGGTAILGRGGSDTSAAYFGALLNAERVEIWTDVPGMFTANPRVVPDARLLSNLEYQEAQEIATTGAKVLHPRCIHPCREANVPLWIRDTERPEMPGTCISARRNSLPGVKAISTRTGIVLISMESIGMWQQVGFLADLFVCFKTHGLSVDMISTSETNVTVSLDPSDNLVNSNVLDALCEDLEKVCRVKVITPCSAVTLVGQGMRSMLDQLTGIWAEFGRERVHLISQSSNDLNLTFVVDDTVAQDLLPTLHALLIESGAMPIEQHDVFGQSWREISEQKQVHTEFWWQTARTHLLNLAAQHTPSYVYHLPTVKMQAEKFNRNTALSRKFYALKANAHASILQVLEQQGFGFECVSLEELELIHAQFPNMDKKRVLFTPSFASKMDYQRGFELAHWVSVDSLSPLQNWPELFQNKRVSLRVDPGYGRGHHAHVRTGGAEAKFGLDLSDLSEFIILSKALSVEIDVLHAHVGSGFSEVNHWPQLYAQLVRVAETIGSVKAINLGGGFSVPYHENEQEFDMDALAQALQLSQKRWPQFEIWMEPGRYLVAQAGVLLAEINQVVNKAGVQRVGLNAGMNALLRPALYGAKHRIVNLSRHADSNMQRVDVVGPICESTDVIAKNISLPSQSQSDDIVLIDTVGAYGFVMANNYNQRALPREEVLDV